MNGDHDVRRLLVNYRADRRRHDIDRRLSMLVVKKLTTSIWCRRGATKMAWLFPWHGFATTTDTTTSTSSIPRASYRPPLEA